MPPAQLGLFDTSPTRAQIRFAVILVGLAFVALAVLSILPDYRMPQVNSFIPMIDSVILLGDLITATLLFVEARVFRARSLIVLASGYVLTGFLLIAHMLSFPGAFAPTGLFDGGVSTTAWIAYFWRGTLPIVIILYVLLRRVDSAAPLPPKEVRGRIAIGVLAAVILAVAFTFLATVGHDLLPSLFVNRTELNVSAVQTVNFLHITLLLTAIATLFVNRKSLLDMWLLVALATWLAHALLNLQVWGRFTWGFYSQFLMLLFSHFVVMLALIGETNRIYARLAISTAARDREREARLMSMDAVAAAISHEAGQPLRAIMLHATAGLNWLDRPRPDRRKAIEAVRAAIEDGQRTFDVIKSIRAMFGKASGAASQFDLNDLVLETVAMLHLELEAAKVVPRLELDETLPPVLASRVQIQRVIINLLTNSIESFGKKRPKSRRIVIRTLHGENGARLEVTDSGKGIAPDQLPHVFDAFFTTKANGTGLGLSLCRTIAEEHGGRVWATSPGKGGATIHVELPSRG